MYENYAERGDQFAKAVERLRQRSAGEVAR
jgi:hypothetical protein